MEKSVSDRKIKIATEFQSIVGNFAVKLRGLNVSNVNRNTKLPLNENEKNYHGKLIDSNYNKTVRKLHDTGWNRSSLKASALDLNRGL